MSSSSEHQDRDQSIENTILPELDVDEDTIELDLSFEDELEKFKSRLEQSV